MCNIFLSSIELCCGSCRALIRLACQDSGLLNRLENRLFPLERRSGKDPFRFLVVMQFTGADKTLQTVSAWGRGST